MGFFAVGGVLLLIVTWFGVAESRFPGLDTAPIADRTTGRLWGDGSFVGITLANALSYGSIFAYIAGAPVIIIGQMGLPSTVFAGVFACTAIALAAGAWTSGQLSRRGTSAAVLLDVSLVFAAGAAIALAVASLSGIVAGAIVMPLLMVVLFTRGLIAPNMQHLAIERQRERAGVASAAVGVSQLLAGAAASAVVAILLPMLGTGAVAYPMAVLATAALLPGVGPVDELIGRHHQRTRRRPYHDITTRWASASPTTNDRTGTCAACGRPPRNALVG